MKAFLLFLTLLPTTARADILFIGLNDNPGELAAARRAAEARKERLIVLAQPDPAVKAEFDRLTVEMNRIYRQLDANPQNLSVLESRIQEISKRQMELRGKLVYGPENLEADLEQLKKKGTKVSTLVLSGHDGNATFFGDRGGQVTAHDLKVAFDKAAPLGENVHSLVMAGCYTGTLGVIESHWAGILPKVALISGFDHAAPLGSVKAGQDYLEDVLKKYQKVIEAGDDAKAFKQVVSGLNGMQGLIAMDRRPAVMARCGEFLFADRNGVSSMKEIIESCGGKLSQEKADQWTDRTQCYLAAAKGCENPPEDTARGELRQIYNQVQDARHCQAALQAGNLYMPEPEVIIRLIFARNVQANVANHFKDQIKAADAHLPPEFRLGDLSKLSREAMLTKVRGAEQWFNRAMNDPTMLSGPKGRELLAAKTNLSQVSTAMSLQPRCVPFTWVEPNATDASSCNRPAKGSEFPLREQAYRYERAFYAALDSQPEVTPLVQKKERLYKEFDRTEDQQRRTELSQEIGATSREIESAYRAARPRLAQQEMERIRKEDPEFESSPIKESLSRLMSLR